MGETKLDGPKERISMQFHFDRVSGFRCCRVSIPFLEGDIVEIHIDAALIYILWLQCVTVNALISARLD